MLEEWKKKTGREGGSGVKRKDLSEMEELVCGPSGMFRPVRIIEWIWNKERQTLFLGCRGMCTGMSGEQIPAQVRHTDTHTHTALLCTYTVDPCH